MRCSRRWLAVLVGSLTAILAACGGEPEGDRAGRQTAAAAADASAEEGFCEHLSQEEITQAFQGALPIGEVRGNSDRCQVEIDFAEGGTLMYGLIPKGQHEAYRGYEDQSSVSFEYLDGLGQEAFVVNDAQVNILLEDDRALMVGLQLITRQEELPLERTEFRQGVIDLARQLVERV